MLGKAVKEKSGSCPQLSASDSEWLCQSFLSFRRSVPSGVGGVELLLSERIRTRLIGELVVVSVIVIGCSEVTLSLLAEEPIFTGTEEVGTVENKVANGCVTRGNLPNSSGQILKKAKKRSTLGLRHGPDSHGGQQWGILDNGRKPDPAISRE
ncbi:hypothetical protein WN943_026965 [Citrus x changshan-huyou]